MLDTIKLDHKKLQEFTKRSHGLLEAIAELNLDFKELCDDVATETSLDKGTVSKYLKARYKAATKEATELGELFQHLDATIDG